MGPGLPPGRPHSQHFDAHPAKLHHATSRPIAGPGEHWPGAGSQLAWHGPSCLHSLAHGPPKTFDHLDDRLVAYKSGQSVDGLIGPYRVGRGRGGAATATRSRTSETSAAAIPATSRGPRAWGSGWSPRLVFALTEQMSKKPTTEAGGGYLSRRVIALRSRRGTRQEAFECLSRCRQR